jgi:hypothetical protein
MKSFAEHINRYEERRIRMKDTDEESSKIIIKKVVR